MMFWLVHILKILGLIPIDPGSMDQVPFFTILEQCKKTLGCLGFLGGIILPGYAAMKIDHYKAL